MKKIVIDACVAIDMAIPRVNFLEDFLDCLDEESILISSVNFDEIQQREIQNKLKSSSNVEIIENDETDFNVFSDVLEPLKINLSRADRHVLYLADISKADYAVSSDWNVIDKIAKYRKVKASNLMKPLTTVTLLSYLYNEGKIQFDTFVEKTLYLYKYKEIDNMLQHLSAENLNVPKPIQIKIINDFKISMRERFQMYKDPLLFEFKQLSNLNIGDGENG
ncbi:MAG TPA: hypothetical protein C5S51_01545 [Methanosarcinaceae archaeon]|nr:hypothetical protein [Methanosarcinaceae archaeon]